MALKLYDTLTRPAKPQPFRPIDPKNVRMYVCGPTVYDFAHIGNARPVIVFDVLFRLLRHLAKQGVWDGGKGETKVTYVRNITDVDDKINARAAERGIPIRQLTEETYANFKSDVKALGCLEPTHEPRATEHINEMKALIERLVANGCAYVAEDHVLFDVKKMPDYGRLSKRSLDEMVAGARVEVAPYKRDAMDFVLWKPSKPGEPAWPSPAGIATPGRPGWHIECSAMANYWLWEQAKVGLSEKGLAHPHQFDIHGGGIDLVFPHHENEIAQSRCAFHSDVMANYWMHNGFLQVEGEKMAKSLGNFVTIREAVHDWDGLAVRFAMLMTHYRQPIDWTPQKLREASRALESLKAAKFFYNQQPEPLGYEPDFDPTQPYPPLLHALCDDLNTPEAVSKLHELLGHISGRTLDHDLNRAKHISMLSNSLNLLGFEGIGSYDYNRVAARRVYGEAFDSSQIETMVDARDAARKAKNFAEADRIRDKLAGMGVELQDHKDRPTTWKIGKVAP